jgi:2-polyprenyl-3-methyl-5-hydroxy-6-metoxy-1,4-benzoquinol methylase
MLVPLTDTVKQEEKSFMNKHKIKQLQEFARLWGGFRASRVVLTANNYRVFDHLKTPKTAGDIARVISVDPRGVEILLDAVTAVGLLKKTGSKYRNTEMTRTFLVKDSPLYQGDMLRHADSLWKSWSGLDEVVKTGLPNRSGGRDYNSFIRAMHNNAVSRAKGVIAAIDLKGIRRALDLGGGPGTYSMELAANNIEVTLFDLPEAIAIAKELVSERGIEPVNFMAGDFHTDDIGSGYDLVFISQIVHSLSINESLALIKKAREALGPRGRIVIHDFLLEKDRARPVHAALFSVNMLVNTTAGRSYTVQEMRGWLTEAGFSAVRAKALGETVIVTGRKMPVEMANRE